MMNKKKKHIVFVLFNLVTVLSILTWGGGSFSAEKFPSREITIVVCYRAGSASDLPARVLAEFLKKDLGVPVIVSNRTEGQGVKGIMDVYKAKPDGYTLLMILLPRQVQMEVAYKTPYKLLEMTYLPAYQEAYQVVTVRKESPYKALKDLVEASKKKSLSCGTAGTGSNSHFLAEMLERRAGLNNDVVPFRGTHKALLALMGGNVDMATVGDTQVKLHKDKLRPLAISSGKQIKKLPGVPTIKQLGYDVPSITTMMGMSGPPNLPKEVQRILSDAMVKVIKSPEFINKVEKTGANPIFMSGPEFRATAELNYKLAEEYKSIFTQKK